MASRLLGTSLAVSALVASGAWATAAAAQGVAQDVTLRAHQLVIAGNQNFDATSINDSGTIVGVLYAAITDVPSGVVVDRTGATPIPAPYAGGGAAHPRQITNDGTIVGYADDLLGGLPTLFVMKGGVVDPNYRTPLEYPNSNSASLSVNPLGLVGTEVFFTRLLSLSLPSLAEYGTPPNFQTVPRLNLFTTIEGLSDAGVASGRAYTFSGRGNVFVGKGDDFTLLAPPGSVSSSGGVQNGAGEVAGSYINATGAAHGFVYLDGTYTSFDMPEAASQVDATAINAKGRVVGDYESAKTGQVHGFFYDGASVTGFGTFDRTAALTVTLNDLSQILIAEQFFDGLPKYLSFEWTCKGSGC